MIDAETPEPYKSHIEAKQREWQQRLDREAELVDELNCLELGDLIGVETGYMRELSDLDRRRAEIVANLGVVRRVQDSKRPI